MKSAARWFPKRRSKTPQDWLPALRYGSLQFAIAVLGNAIVGHITDGYTVADLTTGKLRVVRLRDGKPYCIMCQSDNDDHTAVIRLYRARLGKVV